MLAFYDFRSNSLVVGFYGNIKYLKNLFILYKNTKASLINIDSYMRLIQDLTIKDCVLKSLSQVHCEQVGNLKHILVRIICQP